MEPSSVEIRKWPLGKGVTLVCFLEQAVWVAMMVTTGIFFQFYMKYTEMRPEAHGMLMPVAFSVMFTFVHLAQRRPDLATRLCKWRERRGDVVLEHRTFPLVVGYTSLGAAVYCVHRIFSALQHNFTNDNPMNVVKICIMAVAFLLFSQFTIQGSLQAYIVSSEEQMATEGGTS